MNPSYEQIFQDTLQLLRKLADDWEYNETITRETLFLAELGFESLDVVILSAEVQEHYNQNLPFTDFFEEIGRREVRDVSVGEWVDFIAHNLNKTAVKP